MRETDTPRGLKPHGFSGYGSDGMLVSTPARSRLKAVPPPKRTLQASPGELGSRNNAGAPAWHLVQGPLLLFPVGTMYHGTGKQHAIGEVQSVGCGLLPDGQENGNATRLWAKAMDAAPPGSTSSGLRRAKALFCQRKVVVPWSRDRKRCIDCDTTERAHQVRGRCKHCVDRWRHRNSWIPETSLFADSSPERRCRSKKRPKNCVTPGCRLLRPVTPATRKQRKKGPVASCPCAHGAPVLSRNPASSLVVRDGVHRGTIAVPLH